MAIQQRRGADADFDSNKMLPGEFAVTTDGTRKAYAAFAPGDVREIAFKDQVPIVGNITPAEVQTAVDNYLAENPVQAGATEEQAKQIELNRQNIELNKEGIDKANTNIAQITNSNLFINGNFQIWSNEQSFEVYGTNNEGTTTVICDKWYAKHYDLENNYYITKAGAQGIRLFSASEKPCSIYQILDEETFNALQGKTVTLSWSYTQSYGDANHVEYETIEESKKITVIEDLDVFTAMTRIGFTSGINGCIIHWIKMEVGELKTPCVPDSKDAIICKLEKQTSPQFAYLYLSSAVTVEGGNTIPFDNQVVKGNTFSISNGIVTVEEELEYVRVNATVGGSSEKNRIWMRILRNNTTVYDALTEGAYTTAGGGVVCVAKKGDTFKVYVNETCTAKGGGVGCYFNIEKIC